jgi:hypothetical protein
LNAAQVIEVLDRLDAAEVPVWVDGGWGIDALVGEQTRSHDDLDLVIARPDLSRAQGELAALGLQHALEIEPGLPARLVLRAADGDPWTPPVWDEEVGRLTEGSPAGVASERERPGLERDGVTQTSLLPLLVARQRGR